MFGRRGLASHESRRTLNEMVNWIKLSLVPPVGAFIIRLLGALIRWDRIGDEVMREYYAGGRGMIFAFWHSRQLMMPLAYRGRRIHVLISRHRDGEIIARLIGRFGFHSVRGSTTRGGMTALRSLIRAGEEGGDLCVTPDGPKGPAQVAKPGVVHLAKATGLPIVPVTFGCSKKKLCASWDRFLIPLPFSRGLFLWGQPILVSPDASDSEVEAKRRELEAALNELTARADAMVSGRPRA